MLLPESLYVTNEYEVGETASWLSLAICLAIRTFWDNIYRYLSIAYQDISTIFIHEKPTTHLHQSTDLATFPSYFSVAQFIEISTLSHHDVFHDRLPHCCPTAPRGHGTRQKRRQQAFHYSNHRFRHAHPFSGHYGS